MTKFRHMMTFHHIIMQKRRDCSSNGLAASAVSWTCNIVATDRQNVMMELELSQYCFWRSSLFLTKHVLWATHTWTTVKIGKLVCQLTISPQKYRLSRAVAHYPWQLYAIMCYNLTNKWCHAHYLWILHISWHIWIKLIVTKEFIQFNQLSHKTNKISENEITKQIVF